MDNQPLHMSEEWLPQRIDRAKPRFDKFLRRLQAGDNTVVLEALHFAAMFDVPPPKWVMQAFKKGYESVHGVNAKHRSWDAAFGLPHPKGRKLNGIRNQWKASLIYFEIDWLHSMEKRSIDESLFEEVGKEFGVGKTVCSELYGEFKKLIDADKSASLERSGKL